MSAFLTRNEKKQLQKMYETWNKYANPDLLMEKMYVEAIMSEQEMEECKAKPTVYRKNQYIYEAIVIRSTYDRICKLRTILLNMEDGAHAELAKYIPERAQQQGDPGMQGHAYSYSNQYTHGSSSGRGQDSTPYGDGAGYTTNQTNMGGGYGNNAGGKSFSSTNIGGDTPNRRQENSGNAHTQPDVNHQTRDNPEPYREEDPKYQYGHKPRSDNIEQQPASRLTQQNRNNDVTTNQTATAPQFGERNREANRPGNKKLNVYSTRSQNPKGGKGLCVIIANFTDDLRGYKRDIRFINEFFGKTLEYTVLGGEGDDTKGYRDLTKEQCEEKMKWLKKELENGQYKSCDRFFLFVLSHGDQYGIKMKPKGRVDSSLTDRIKSDWLVETFAHGELPNLKGYPKCFFIQVCSGAEIAKAAKGSATGEADTEEKRSPVVAVGADTLVCHASKEGTYSWVSQGEASGSWFLQATLEVFREYYQDEHILDMLTEVNDKVSKKRGLSQVTTQYDENKILRDVFQLPAISNNLTKKLYLGN